MTDLEIAYSPLVSIGVPTYNRPEGLRRAVNSLISQTYPNLEIIISDNCSTNTEVSKVLDELAVDPRIKVYRQSINQGPIFNFNFVSENTNGDFFMRLADDDWIDVNYIQTCLEYLLSHEDCSAACGFTRIHSLKGDYLHDDANVDLSLENPIERVILYFKTVSHNGTYYGLYRSEFKDIMTTRRELADDWLAVARLLFAGKMKLIGTTSNNISLGGVSSNVDNIVKQFKLSKFTRVYPFLSVALSLANDIIWKSKVYRKVSFSKRLGLAISCFGIIYKRFDIRNEILLRYMRNGYVKFG